SDATKELKNLLPSVEFDTVKPVNLIKTLLYVSTDEGDIVLDFFAGSGTTAHAVLLLNKFDKKKRKFILIEMEDYCFYKIIIPRLKKLAYSLDWKNGAPIGKEGYSMFFKYYELESYEDVLSKASYGNLSNETFEFFKRDPYNYYVFMNDEKMMNIVEIDYEKNSVKIFLDNLYQNIDIPESLSVSEGLKIMKIKKESVYFDKKQVNVQEISLRDLKRFLFW
ncbi:MAG: site-specific DNA-methyltransferase, partial [Candidatus Diapherotrites archaeon]|nr:site-specific DNA-methyltransferase [Candidatus Diapherotrites archaeon]